ncbi:MAG: hypothetical protein JSU65_03335 [Candidatus Zixiibacteriota bacterium]|nr:MAG: hypothetical protein JSU65_03335 [candidate division Zixibacteria bacterium]
MKKLFYVLALLLAFLLMPSGDLVSLDVPWEQGPGDGEGDGDGDGDDHPWGGISDGDQDDPREVCLTATGIPAVDIVYFIWIQSFSFEIQVSHDNNEVAQSNQTYPTESAGPSGDNKLSNGNGKVSK